VTGLRLSFDRAVRVLLVAASGSTVIAAAQDQAPPGFQRFMARGRIPAVDDPQLVAASAAKLPPEAWVLGVVIEGQARAYSLNLLNAHEVVNDRFGDRPVAVIWCPLANAGAAYDAGSRAASCGSRPRAC